MQGGTLYHRSGDEYKTDLYGGGGGGGGYTNTMKNVAVTPGQQLSIVVGAGGSGGADGSRKGGDGGSGICIIHWDDQKS